MATLGDPEQDLAWYLFFDRHHSEGCGAPPLPGFPSREESIARYEEWTGRATRHVAYYEIFAAFRSP
jgi:aminoglycoside phosphotransferase (APT) family kinase protein